MNKILTITVLFFALFGAKGQNNCLDAIVTQAGDTIFGKMIEITDSSYTLDSYNLVLSLSKDMVKAYLPCCKEVTRLDLMKMQPLDNLSDNDLFHNTAGDYLRRSSKAFYLGLPLTLAGTVTGTLALTLCNQPGQQTLKWITFSCGTVAVAGGMFFLLRSFYLIDKAGKILDLERSAIYLDANSTVGIIWKF
ncbi:MAG: hypothetical protein LBR36_00505 [Bacteroidales bacterium]|jgi:GAF domain-containing protein|nr:hypothetical protein [Bacteroidales bacterium]